mmetsp:Transcript_4062/g.9840  ORF Transcript_4062/g.9840 Transcript_4062/m.9840 type:complete len:351 (+) Transcript_4062:481-1533(+)
MFSPWSKKVPGPSNHRRPAQSRMSSRGIVDMCQYMSRACQGARPCRSSRPRCRRSWWRWMLATSRRCWSGSTKCFVCQAAARAPSTHTHAHTTSDTSTAIASPPPERQSARQRAKDTLSALHTPAVNGSTHVRPSPQCPTWTVSATATTTAKPSSTGTHRATWRPRTTAAGGLGNSAAPQFKNRHPPRTGARPRRRLRQGWRAAPPRCSGSAVQRGGRLLREASTTAAAWGARPPPRATSCVSSVFTTSGRIEISPRIHRSAMVTTSRQELAWRQAAGAPSSSRSASVGRTSHNAPSHDATITARASRTCVRSALSPHSSNACATGVPVSPRRSNGRKNAPSWDTAAPVT